MRNEFFDFYYWKNVFTGSDTRKRLTENFLSLSVLQALNYLLPLITLPYLVRVLGPEKYGLISFAQAFIGYFVILTDYGFNLSATREISINRENEEKVSEIFSSVMIIKFLLGILSFFILGLILLFIPKFKNDWIIYLFTFGTVLGNILFPVWFFQGMENMKWITILNVIARGIFTVLIFVFVHKESDYLNVAIINSLGLIIAGIISLIIVFKNFKIKFILPKLESIKNQLKEGWHIFIAQVAISGYTYSRTFAVGLFTNNTITGYYAIAEKLMNVIQTFPLGSITQSLYPRISKIYTENKQKAINLMKRFQKFTILVYLIWLPIIYFLSPLLIKIIAGEPYPEVILAFRLLLLAIFFINANAFRVNFLLISGRDNIYSKIHIIMGIIGLFLTFLMTYFFSFVGTATSIIIISFFVLILTIKYLLKENLKI